MATQRRSENEIKHKTLSTYYARLTSLEWYLRTTLVRPGDDDEYVQFVSGTICASHSVQPIAIRSAPLGVDSRTHQECVDWIMGDLVGRGKNVLVQPRCSRSEESLPGRSSPSSALHAPIWRRLRARIGDSALKHLILHTSLFKPVGNNSYLQITGLPICDLYEGKKRPERKRKRVREGGGGKKRKVVPETRQGSGPADVYISRQKMFYGQGTKGKDGRFAAGLHPQHALNATARCNVADRAEAVHSLMLGIFHRSPGTGASCEVKNPRRKEKLLTMVDDLLRRHAAIDYDRLLGFCVERSRDITRDGLQPMSHSQVCRFVSTILAGLVTPAVGELNAQVIRRHARRLITAKQFEPINLHSILTDVKVSECAWAGLDTPRPNPTESRTQRSLVERFIFWLFEDYLVPLIKNTFYVTETAATKYQTVYYPHEAWAAAARPHFHKLQHDTLERLDQVQEAMALQGPLGVSAVRLIPKPNGFRPIVNLGRRISGKHLAGVVSRGVQRGSTANHLLRGIHQVLSYEKDRKRNSLGSSLFGTNEIFAPLHALKDDLLQRHGKMPRLFFVKMDIKAAFDTIKQDKVLSVIEMLLDDDYDYLLMLYSLLLPPASEASQGSARRLFKTRAVVDDVDGFAELAQVIAKPLRNAVIVDLQRSRRVTKHECMKLLHQHIKQNTWQIGSHLYRQKQGIPQGSIISSLLCSLFYGALEKEHLSFVNKPGSRLLRYIDDFLYITDDLASARRFIGVMTHGFPEYGAFIAPDKTLRSFEYAKGDHVGAVCPNHRDGSTYFPFCGFWINAETLEMSIDIPRITSGDLAQSFALRSARHRGKAFVGWLSRQLENRNHVAYLDTVHNGLETVHLNVFFNFSTTAMKIAHYFKEDISPRFARIIFESICLSVGYTYVAGRARVRHSSRESHQPEKHHQIRRADFEYLAKTAIVLALGRKAGRVKDVIGLLKQDLMRREYRMMEKRHAGVVSRWEEVKHARY